MQRRQIRYKLQESRSVCIYCGNNLGSASMMYVPLCLTHLCQNNILGNLLTSGLLNSTQLCQANNFGTFAYFWFIKFNTAMSS